MPAGRPIRRAGDAAAYDTLYRRHVAAAHGLAGLPLNVVVRRRLAPFRCSRIAWLDALERARETIEREREKSGGKKKYANSLACHSDNLPAGPAAIEQNVLKTALIQGMRGTRRPGGM